MHYQTPPVPALTNMAEVSEEDGLPKFIDPRSMEEVWAQKSAHTAELLSKHLKDVEVDLVSVCYNCFWFFLI